MGIGTGFGIGSGVRWRDELEDTQEEEREILRLLGWVGSGRGGGVVAHQHHILVVRAG